MIKHEQHWECRIKGDDNKYMFTSLSEAEDFANDSLTKYPSIDEVELWMIESIEARRIIINRT